MKPTLILDTGACGEIRDSRVKKAIIEHLKERFRFGISIATFWELIDAIYGSDDVFFERDRERLQVASGYSSRPLILPTAGAFAIQRLLRLPPPETALTQKDYKRIFSVIMKAKSHTELLTGVRMPGAVNQRVAFDPKIVRRQMAEGEEFHIERLKLARKRGLRLPEPELWVRNLVSSLELSDDQAKIMAKGLKAAYSFDRQLWEAAVDLKNPYNFEKHKNDWIDWQQTIYLCDPSVHFMTCDKKLLNRMASSVSNHVHHLPTYLRGNNLEIYA